MVGMSRKYWMKPVLNTVAVVVAIGAALLLRSKYERFAIPQNGMYPNYPANASFWVTKNAYDSVADVQLGDVIVFRRL